jgi:adenylate cyclase
MIDDTADGLTSSRDADGSGGERAFLIADVRGYTRFTRERGDEEAAQLAMSFAELARDAVEARGGRVVELRGDEALAVFDSAAQAVRAATELAAICSEQPSRSGGLALPVGIGIDAGDAVAVGDGFRGAALNMAARLCSQAAGGQVLVSFQLAELAGDVPGVAFKRLAPVELKGLDAAVELIEAISSVSPRAAVPSPLDEVLPRELERDMPLAGREHELSWLRGTWRHPGAGASNLGELLPIGR